MELTFRRLLDEGSIFCERIPEIDHAPRSCSDADDRCEGSLSVVEVLKVEDGIVRNVETGGREEPVDDLSSVLKKEVTNPRKDTPFVVLMSLLATLALARAFVLLTGAAETTTETSTSIGRNLIIGGYHIHHFFYGFGLICAAAWIAIQYPTRNLPRLAAVLFGGGLGLCVDEMGYFLGGQVNYFDRTTYFIALSIIVVLLAALSFRSFRVATQEDLRWLVGRRPRGIAILAVLQVLASLALLVGGLVLVVAASLPPSIDVQGEAAAFALGAVLVLLGVLSLIVAWGLWTLQPWARKVAILFAIVSLGTDVISIITGNYANAVALLLDLLLIWYLTRPGVRAAFVRVDRSGQGAQESN